MPPFCVSSKLLPIHIIFLDYVSAIYPLSLILLIYIAVELHGRNFRPLVHLWRSFQRCCVSIRRGWNTRSDIIDSFASFFLLSYSKFIYQSFKLLGYQYRQSMNTGASAIKKVALFDLDAYCFSRRHLPFAIFSIIFLLVFVLLPTLLIIPYPSRAFRALLSKCRLSSHIGLAIHTFVERFYKSCRDGLDGGRDLRSFSCLYFILMILIVTHHQLQHLFPILGHPSLIEIILFFSSVLLVALIKPYKNNRDTIINTLMLALLAARSVFVYIYSYIQSDDYNKLYARIILATAILPQVVFWMFIILKLVVTMCKLNIHLEKIKIFLNTYLNKCHKSESLLQPTAEESQALVEPTEITKSHYGTYQ